MHLSKIVFDFTNEPTVPIRVSAAIQKSDNWKDRKEQGNNDKFVMWCLGSNYNSKFHQATFLAIFNLQWTLVIRNSKESGNLFLILGITLSVQNLACIKFGDWQTFEFWRGLNLANQKITKSGVDLFWRIVKRHHFSKLPSLRINRK